MYACRYPHECEVVFPPLTSVEMSKRQKVGSVTKVSAVLSPSIVPQTVKEAASSMRLSYMRLLQVCGVTARPAPRAPYTPSLAASLALVLLLNHATACHTRAVRETRLKRKREHPHADT